MAESLLAKALGRIIRAMLRDEIVILSAEWLDKDHAIQYLQGTKATLEILRNHGLPCKRVGKKLYFRKADINHLIAISK
jgi:hypothetical protein